MDTQSQRLAAELMHDAHVSMWLCNRDFEIVLWNSGAEEIYGFTREEAIGHSFLDLFVDEAEREDAQSDCSKIIDYGTRFRNFLAYDRRSDGSTRYMLTNCFRVVDPVTGSRYQAEVGVEISGLDLQREKHRTLRELGIARRERTERRFTSERDDFLLRVGRVVDELTYLRDRRKFELEAFLRVNIGQRRHLVRDVHDRQVRDLDRRYGQVQLELENLALRCKAASTEDEIRSLSDELGDDPRRWVERLRDGDTGANTPNSPDLP